MIRAGTRAADPHKNPILAMLRIPYLHVTRGFTPTVAIRTHRSRRERDSNRIENCCPRLSKLDKFKKP